MIQRLGFTTFGKVVAIAVGTRGSRIFNARMMCARWICSVALFDVMMFSN